MGGFRHGGRAPVVVAILVLLVSAALGPVVAPALAASCPDQPLSVADLNRLQGDDGLLILADVNHAGRRCYGSSTIRIVAWSGTPTIMGWEGPWYLEPGWLGDIGIALYDTAVTHDEWTVPGYHLAWDGTYGVLQARYRHEWVSVTAHFDDSAARTCHATGTSRPSRASLVRECRSVLVVDSVRSLGGLDTSTAGRDASAPAGPWPALLVAGLAGAMGWVKRGRPQRCRHASSAC